jgi:isoleucyl-tRNA synthetase
MSEENKKTQSVTPKSGQALREEKVLEFWKDNKIFEATLNKPKTSKGDFVFYEGPPTANGKPGIHHLEARAFKDAIPRYKTMQGFYVRRKGGWDTHGLPVELQVEKALELNSKKAIEEYGIAKFNDKCKESVWQFLDIWEKFTDRIGYWVDQENPYVTYHNSYIESVWNVLQKVNDRGLMYKDYRIVPWCPRCGTALSSHELAQGYQDDKDLSVTAKFKLVGQENTYILAWTTTPWTLPGNVALAVGNDIEYAYFKYDDSPEIYISAHSYFDKILKEGGNFDAKKRIPNEEIIKKVKGSDLVGLEYEPLYSYLKDNIAEEQKAKLEKAFKVYPADFVTTEDGTGVVHTAVMYGADDFELGTKLGLPKQHMVNLDGTFVSYADFLAGRFVKDEEVAVDIIKDLAHRGLLFKKEKYEHSYPHCWRCKTPLIYYARDSWYIRVSSPEIKDKMIEENKNINWEPSYIRDGRFGEWLKDIKDWAISRERYWGTPLPIWMTAEGKIEVVGGVDELKAKTKKSGNRYFAMRHGFGQHMENGGSMHSLDHDSYHLTEEGKNEVSKSAHMLHENKITKIFCSPLIRTKETARITAEHIGINPDQIIVDTRLREYDFGDLEGMSYSDFAKYRDENLDAYDEKFGGSSLLETKKRFGEFLYEIESKYQNENILIVTHGIFFETTPAVLEGADNKRSLEILFDLFNNYRIQPAEVRELKFVPIPHNQNFELDLHKPYIDDVTLISNDGQEMTRVKEVMDVWFDSGAMPFAQDHYPFENKEVAYPADYICEAIDQTRGWFYTLHAVGTLMGKGMAYKNVICLGHILDEKGKKMSKSLGNIVDPWVMIDKYGVDTLRLWMYSVNQPGESKNFDEKTVSELHNKVFNLLYNVIAFYELYRDTELEKQDITFSSTNVLDGWIVARLGQLMELSTTNLDSFKLLEPVRAMREFVDDLSTWYVRRSRDRIKDGDNEAKQTLYFVLKTFTKLLAPFAPFASEDIWQKLKNDKDEKSVHLAEWPKASEVNQKIIEEMMQTREVITLGLQQRQKQAVPVRQPLGSAHVVSFPNLDKYIEIIKDELNVEEVSVLDEKSENKISLDFTITPDLKKKGNYRELVRAVQDMRKKAGLTPSDVISLVLSDNIKEIVSLFEADMKKTVLAKEISFGLQDGESTEIDGMKIFVQIVK